MTRLFLLLCFSLSILSADRYLKLEDGSTILLKDNGTWSRVEVEPGKSVKAKPVAAVEDVQLLRKIRQNLQGKWLSGDKKLQYLFKEDKVIFTSGRKSRESRYKIQNIDDKELTFTLNAGESGTFLAISFGGFMRKLRFSKDFSTLYDETDPIAVAMTR